jgi:DNA polymerase elongation subunit (family B)
MSCILREDICVKNEILNQNILTNKPIHVLFNTDSGNIEYLNKESYDHFIYGTLENSEKCILHIRNIPLILDIELQTNDPHIEHLFLMNILRQHSCERIKIVYLKPFREYKYNPIPYARCYFKTAKGRYDSFNKLMRLTSKKLINKSVAKIINPNCDINVYDIYYEVGSDENYSAFIYKFAKEYNLSLSSWNVLLRYKYNDKFNGIHYFTCDINDIYYAPSNADRMAIQRTNNIRIIPDSYIELCKPLDVTAIRNQSLLIMYFDIETYTDRCNPHIKTSRDIPDAKTHPDTDSVFIVSCVFYWSHQNKPMDNPIYTISVFNTYGKFTKEELLSLTNNSSEYERIKNNIFADSERDLLIEFTEIMNKMRPDIISGFNSAQYDIPFIVNKLMYYKLYNYFYNYTTCNPLKVYKDNDNTAMKTSYNSRSIKLKADNYMEGYQIDIPGILCVDTMQILRKAYPDDEKYSLNYFLDKLELGQKSDMEYKRLFSIVDNILTINSTNKTRILEQILVDIRDAIVYCEMDSALCYRLWAKETIMLKSRFKAELSFVNLNNAFNRADSNKVINMVIANSPHLVFQYHRNIDVFDGKFTGAYVVDPKVRGLYTDKPVDELDVTSLYPSIMRAYNLSSEMISRNEEYIEAVKQQYNIKARKLEIAVDTNIERGYAVFHQNKDEYKGVYVLILDFLMAKRKDLKKKLFIVEGLIKATLLLKTKIATINMDNIKKTGKPLSEEEIYKIANFNDKELELLANYDENIYQRDVAEADQLAAKIFMNTFYGITGDKNGMFYELLVSASVTHFGQVLLKEAHVLTKHLNYTILYGDTDSMYVAAPTELFLQIREDYNNKLITKEEYLTKMCYISKDAADILMHKVNNLFKEMTDTECIKLSHDTTGYPSFWACKKKYSYCKQEFTKGMVPKFDYVEFDSEHYKIKGLAIVTRGQTQILHSTGEHIIYNMLYESLDSNESLTYTSDKVFIYYDNTIIFTNTHEYEGIYESLVKELAIRQKNSFINDTKKLLKKFDEIPNKKDFLSVTVMILEEVKDIYDLLSEENKDFMNHAFTDYTSKPHILANFRSLAVEDAINKMKVDNKEAYIDIYMSVISSLNEKYNRRFTNIMELGFTNSDTRNSIKRLEDIQFKPIVIKNDRLFEIVVDQINTIISTKWKINDFIQSSTYRPGKDNKRINKFVERLKERNISTPEAGERFKFVIVKPKRFTNIDGSYIKTNVGDLMEYPEIAINDDREIYLQQYLNGALKGMLSRFISYLFHERNSDSTVKLQVELNEKEASYVEKLTMRYATKLIDSIIEFYSKDKFNRTQERIVYKTKYKEYNTYVKTIIAKIYDNETVKSMNKIDKMYKILFKIIEHKEEDEEADDEEDGGVEGNIDDVVEDIEVPMENSTIMSDSTFSTSVTVTNSISENIISSCMPIMKLEGDFKKEFVKLTERPISELLKIKSTYLHRDESKNRHLLKTNGYIKDYLRQKDEFLKLYDNKLSMKSIISKIYEYNITNSDNENKIMEIISNELTVLKDIEKKYQELYLTIQSYTMAKEFMTFLCSLEESK